jgi:hypothetical protein
MAGFLGSILKSILSGQTGTGGSGFSDDQLVVDPSPSFRNDRIEREVFMIAARFAQSEGIFFDERNKDWLMIPKYPLPERWEERWCKLLIVFPETYPETPPIGFYLNKEFQLKRGGNDSHLTGRAHDGAADLMRQGWFWYCVRIEARSAGGWQPSTDYRQPDNLWTFLNMVRESLTNDF